MLNQALSDSSSLRVQASPKRTLTKGGEYDYHTFGYNQLHSGQTVTTSLCTCVCFLWRTTLYHNAHIFEHQKNHDAIPPQLVQMTTKSILVYNLNLSMLSSQHADAMIPMYEIMQTLWEFTECQGAPRHLLQLAEKISSVFLWATRHRMGSTRGTTRDHDEREAKGRY